MSKLTPIYRASDNTEWDTPVAVEKHEAVIEAVAAYQRAGEKLGSLLAESSRTADGKPFDFKRFRSYHYITPGYFERPSLVQVRFYNYRNVDFDFTRGENSQVRLMEMDSTGNRPTHFYNINELYEDKAAADKALLAAQREWLAQQQEEVNELAAKVEPQVEATNV